MKRKKSRSTLQRVKLVPFMDAARVLAETIGRDLPEPPKKILCMLPDHEERSPSFHLYEDHWYCYGCCRGGRAIELAGFMWGLPYDDTNNLPVVLDRLAPLLGLGSEDDLQSHAAVLRSPLVPVSEVAKWSEATRALEAAMWLRLSPYLRCRDPDVRAVSASLAQYVLEELREAQGEPAPRTPRGRRERMRRLSAFAREAADEVEGRVRQVTGRDRLDVRTLAPLPSPFLKAEVEFVRWLLAGGASKEVDP